MFLKTNEITSCRLCNSKNLSLVLDYGNMPMAGGFVPDDDPRSNAFAPLRLGICEVCGLMQTLDSVDPDEIFNKYSYKSSISGALVSHFRSLADQIERLVRVNITGSPLCVDIGCNDGVLLKPLVEKGYDVIGIDPSDVAERASVQNGWKIIKRYMNNETAKLYNSVFRKADIVTACNVLAHTDHIHEMVEGVKSILSENGIFIIEVQYQGDLVSMNQFDTVYHEHCSYFSASNIATLLEMHGLKAWNIKAIPTHSGSIRVLASHENCKRGTYTHLLNSEKSNFPPNIRAKMFSIDANKARSRIQRVFSLINDRSGTKECIAYGAAGRATILINWCGLDDRDISFVVDASPLRQGKVIPGTNIKILTPDHIKKNTDVIMITAWNYADHIMRQHPEHKGLWMIPLPDVRLI